MGDTQSAPRDAEQSAPRDAEQSAPRDAEQDADRDSGRAQDSDCNVEDKVSHFPEKRLNVNRACVDLNISSTKRHEFGDTLNTLLTPNM